MRFELPGVFDDNPFPKAVNGSLWTLPFELRWYFILLIAGALRLINWKWVILVAFFCLVIFQFGIYHGQTNPNRNYSRELGLYFSAGCVLYLFKYYWEKREKIIAVFSILLGAVVFALGQHALGLLIALPPTVIFFCTSSTPILRSAGRFGDLSYGVYIYAFMVQQTLIWYFGGAGSFSLHLIAATAITLVCAWLSWHLIESPILSLKTRLAKRPIKTKISEITA